MNSKRLLRIGAALRWSLEETISLCGCLIEMRFADYDVSERVQNSLRGHRCSGLLAALSREFRLLEFERASTRVFPIIANFDLRAWLEPRWHVEGALGAVILHSTDIVIVSNDPGMPPIYPHADVLLH
jgi:hypothetical protein